MCASSSTQPLILSSPCSWKEDRPALLWGPVNGLGRGGAWQICSITLKSSRVPRAKIAETARVPPGKWRRLTLSLLHRRQHDSGQEGLRHNLASNTVGNCKIKQLSLPRDSHDGVMVNYTGKNLAAGLCNSALPCNGKHPIPRPKPPKQSGNTSIPQVIPFACRHQANVSLDSPLWKTHVCTTQQSLGLQTFFFWIKHHSSEGRHKVFSLGLSCSSLIVFTLFCASLWLSPFMKYVCH